MGNAEVQSVHVYPVKAFRGLAPRKTVVELWGLAGDRRWTLIDDGGKVVTQREQPRLALAAAEPVSGGVRLSAPGHAPLTVRVPEPTATVPVNIFGTKAEAVAATADAHAWCGAYLSIRSTRCPARRSASPTATRCSSPRRCRSVP